MPSNFLIGTMRLFCIITEFMTQSSMYLKNCYIRITIMKTRQGQCTINPKMARNCYVRGTIQGRERCILMSLGMQTYLSWTQAILYKKRKKMFYTPSPAAKYVQATFSENDSDTAPPFCVHATWVEPILAATKPCKSLIPFDANQAANAKIPSWLKSKYCRSYEASQTKRTPRTIQLALPNDTRAGLLKTELSHNTWPTVVKYGHLGNSAQFLFRYQVI